MKTGNKDTGRIGEELTEELLTKKGYKILKRNFATRFGEIDIICKEADSLVFVEVKTKKGLNFGSPEEMFTTNKLNRVRRMAEVYLQGKLVKCRIDMVAVVLDREDKPTRITHYPNVEM